MRSLKFKLVNKKTKKVDYIELSNENCGCGWTQSTDVVFLQFTGVIDMNGLDIYEGDKINYNIYEKTYTGELVRWNKVFAGFEPFIFYEDPIEDVFIVGHKY